MRGGFLLDAWQELLNLAARSLYLVEWPWSGADKPCNVLPAFGLTIRQEDLTQEDPAKTIRKVAGLFQRIAGGA